MLEGTVEECVWCFLLVPSYSKFNFNVSLLV